MAEKTKEISSQSKQATGKMGSKVKENIRNKKCIIAELKPRLNSMEIKVSTLFMYYPLARGISQE